MDFYILGYAHTEYKHGLYMRNRLLWFLREGQVPQIRSALFMCTGLLGYHNRAF